MASRSDLPEQGLAGFGFKCGPVSAAIVQNRFQRSPYLPLRKITCRLENGRLLLQGRVPTYYLKQLAQTIAYSFEGIDQVINELNVDFPDRIH